MVTEWPENLPVMAASFPSGDAPGSYSQPSSFAASRHWLSRSSLATGAFSSSESSWIALFALRKLATTVFQMKMPIRMAMILNRKFMRKFLFQRVAAG